MSILNLVLMFFAYSFAGWLNEVILIRISNGHFVNRGFLVGPYCPVYGTGGVLITLLLSKYQGDYLVLFGMSLVICTTLEYFVSWIMEILFHARWWDYTTKPMNINGRVWLGNACLFGFAGVFVVEVVNPLFFQFLDHFSLSVLKHLAFVLIVFIVIDFGFSFFTIYHFRKEAITLTKDATEEIVARVKAEKDELKEQVMNDFECKAKQLRHIIQIRSEELRLRFDHKSYLYRRLVRAYPKFELRGKTLRQLQKEIHDILTSNH